MPHSLAHHIARRDGDHPGMRIALALDALAMVAWHMLKKQCSKDPRHRWGHPKLSRFADIF